jgi:hypothetical protein
MFLKGVSVKLVIKLKPETEGDSTNYNVTGSEDISRLTLGIVTIGHSEPQKRIKPVNDSQNPKMSVKDRRQDVLPEQMKTITLKETSSCIDEPMSMSNSIGGSDQVIGETGSLDALRVVRDGHK